MDLFRRDASSRVPALAEDNPFQRDPAWRDLVLFRECFHGDTGQGLGATHETGWTGLVANLLSRRYRDRVPAYWREDRLRAVADVPTTDP